MDNKIKLRAPMSKDQFSTVSNGILFGSGMAMVVASSNVAHSITAGAIIFVGGYSLLGVFNIVGTALNYIEDCERFTNDKRLPIQAANRQNKLVYTSSSRKISSLRRTINY